MGESESEDSENEGTMGNVTRVVMRPPGHSGKAKKGHLCFDASFETGNLGSIELVSPFEYDLFVRPDTCNPRLRLWFNFTVDNTKPDQRVVFNIVNFSKKRNTFRYGMTPLVRSTSRPIWQRMPKEIVFYHSSPYHNGNYVLSIAFNFDKEDDVYQFAFCFPYSYTKCQMHLDILEKRSMPYFKRETLGQSIQKRKVELLTITESKNMVPNGKVHVIVILARMHPGESPSSFVCQGLIDFLISSNPVAMLLRDKLVFKIIPMVNPDGVFLGNFRCSLVGADLNRSWGKISKWLHPTLDAIYTYISSLDQDKSVELDFVLDIHAHSNLRGAFVYGNTYNDVYRYERHILFPKLLAQNVLGYDNNNTVFNKDPNRSNSARRVLCDLLRDSVNCYSVIVSFYGYIHQNTVHYYTEESYYKIGRDIVHTFLDYYKATGYIEERKSKIDVVLKHTGQWKESRLTSTAIHRRKRDFQMIPGLKPSGFKILELHLTPSKELIRARREQRSARRLRQLTAKPKPLEDTPPSLSIIDFNKLTIVDLGHKS